MDSSNVNRRARLFENLRQDNIAERQQSGSDQAERINALTPAQADHLQSMASRSLKFRR